MGKAVLVIENSEADLRAIRTALRDGSLSLPIAAFASGSDAKAFLMEDGAKAGSRFTVIVVNIHAAECEGLAFLEWLREQAYFPNLLIVAVTERSQLRDVVRAYERGAHTFFVKPMHVEDVKMLVKTYPQHCG